MEPSSAYFRQHEQLLHQRDSLRVTQAPTADPHQIQVWLCLLQAKTHQSTLVLGVLTTKTELRNLPRCSVLSTGRNVSNVCAIRLFANIARKQPDQGSPRHIIPFPASQAIWILSKMCCEVAIDAWFTISSPLVGHSFRDSSIAAGL